MSAGARSESGTAGADAAPMSLETHGVSWAVSGATIVDEVSVRVEPGRTLGILGPNGSGKTTLMRMMSGQLRPSGGSVSLQERPITDFSRREVARRLAVLEQQSATDDDLSVRDVIDLGRIPHRPLWSGRSGRDQDVVAQAAARTGVDELLGRAWRTLSGGEQQRVQLARAFAQEPGILLLDEPTNHLDIRAQLRILAMARAAPATVVVALHDLNLATTFCDEIVVMRRGRVVAAGPPQEVISAGLVADVYGVDAIVDHTEHGTTVRFLAPLVDW